MCSRENYLLWVGCGIITGDDFQENYDPESPPKAKMLFGMYFQL